MRRLFRREQRLLIGLAIVFLATSSTADNTPVLHERVRPSATLDAWLGRTESPGRHAPASPSGRAADGAASGRPSPRGSGAPSEIPAFLPDRETQTPDVRQYDEPFVPSVAPFKRLYVFDAVGAGYALTVRDPQLTPVPLLPPAGRSVVATVFRAELFLPPDASARIRIPSVGADAWVEQVTFEDDRGAIPARIVRDGADNWFVEAGRPFGHAHLDMRVAVDPAALGADFGDPPWSALPIVPPLPPRIAAAAQRVGAAVGLDRPLSPRETLTKLVDYFRGFTDGAHPAPSHDDIYLDLALEKRGVCRHRAFAFVVTAQAFGLASRLVENEAHAWVEVATDQGFRRIDLGGAGRIARVVSTEPAAGGARATPPADPFAWPAGSNSSATAALRAAKRSTTGETEAKDIEAAKTRFWGDAAPKDSRPRTEITMAPASGDVRRGTALHLHGDAQAAGVGCANLPVEIVLESRGPHANGGPLLVLGTLATDDGGVFDGELVVGGSIPRGDYDVKARTPGAGRCGKGASP